jgi:hypothetical protein
MAGCERAQAPDTSSPTIRTRSSTERSLRTPRSSSHHMRRPSVPGYRRARSPPVTRRATCGRSARTVAPLTRRSGCACTDTPNHPRLDGTHFRFRVTGAALSTSSRGAPPVETQHSGSHCCNARIAQPGVGRTRPASLPVISGPSAVGERCRICPSSGSRELRRMGVSTYGRGRDSSV